MSEKHSPLAQFEVHPLIKLPEIAGYDISFTNSSLLMVLAVTSVILFLSLSTSRKALVPGRWQSMAELSFQFVAGMVKDTVGSEGKQYFPLIFTLFLFILFANLLGMVPYSFTVTSHIIVTFAMAAFVFVGVTILGFVKHGLKFLGMFLPHGTPWWIAWLIIPIEMISFLIRPVSLSLRLAANMMAGHTLMKVVAGFVIMLGVWGVAPIAFLVLLTGFEIFVAVLQAYIFTMLTCVYLNDALHMH